ncbi:MAG: DUF1178 family protein [Alphaproteobacteria bacterium]
MIHYQLRCSRDHEFEAWFRSSASFDAQCKRGDIDCPVCGDLDISKALMAPSLGKNTRNGSATDPEQRAREVARQILDTAGKLQRVVEDNCEYVGDDFAGEARAIHDGEAEERGIYGEATEKEATELDDDGIEILRLPNFSGRPRKND